MIYLLYIIMVPVSLIITLIAVIFAPIMPIFRANIYGWCNNGSYEGFGPRLHGLLTWFQTPDNSLDGDETFYLANPPSYFSQVKWLWRNPAYAFGLRYLDYPTYPQWNGDRTIKDNDNAKEGWLFVRAGGLFQFTYVKRIFSSSRCIYVNLGWNIRALVDPNAQPRYPYQATFVFSPRISGYR